MNYKYYRSAASVTPALSVSVWIIALMTNFTGCGGSVGPERATVIGNVTLDGMSVEEGSIAFIPTGQTTGPTAGAVIKDGRYVTPDGTGPVLGAHRVEITAFRRGTKVESAGVGGATSGPSASSNVEQIEMYIPKHYNKNSKLSVDIKSGRNQKDFALNSKETKD